MLKQLIVPSDVNIGIENWQVHWWFLGHQLVALVEIQHVWAIVETAPRFTVKVCKRDEKAFPHGGGRRQAGTGQGKC